MPKKIPEDEARKVMLSAGLNPIGIYSKASYAWECECMQCGEIVAPKVSSIKQGQGGCSYCAGNKISPKKAIELMKINGYEPLDEYPGNKKPWRSIHLNCGDIVYPKYNAVQQYGICSCKTCSKMYVDPDDAELRMIAAGVIPQEKYPGKDKPWKCLCLKCNKIVNSHYSTVRDGGGGCQQCALRVTAIGRRISDTEVREAYLRVNLEPIEKYTNTDVPLRCKCLKCGNYPSPSFTSIRSGSGCRYCAEKLTSPEKALGLANKVGLEPLEEFINGQTPWKCKHLKCGKIVFPLFGTILKGGSGCINCNSKVFADNYRMPEAKAVAIMMHANMQPLEPYVNALSNWKCKCLVCEKIITPKLNSVQNGSGCRHCTNSGFDLNAAGYFYLMLHPDLNSLKVGIGGSENKVDRIQTHEKYGWILFKRKDFASGNIAYELEQSVMSWLRVDLGLPIYLAKENMPQSGHTETVDASEIDLPTIWAKVEELSKK